MDPPVSSFVPLRQESSSSRVGMLGWAPGRVTERAAASVANRPASSSLRPSARAAANAPFQASPAAVVSTTSTLGAGQNRSLSLRTRSAPSEPRLATTAWAPRARRERAWRRASRTVARRRFSRQRPQLRLVGGDRIGEGQEVLHPRSGRRRVENHPRSALAGEGQGPRDRGQGDLELDEDEGVGVHESRDLVHISRPHRAVRSRAPPRCGSVHWHRFRSGPCPWGPPGPRPRGCNRPRQPPGFREADDRSRRAPRDPP